MNEQHTKKLINKYPKIFAGVNKPPTESLMCFGFECGDGWYAILDALCHNIQYHIDNPPWVPENVVIRVLKRAWNQTVWNWIIFPIGSFFLTRNNARVSCPIYPNPKYDEKKWKLWRKLQDTFCYQLKFKKPNITIPQVVAVQVKEKFGTLRFYYDGGDRTVQDLVNLAESMSARTCEICGATDDSVHMSKTGWVTVRCERCSKNVL